ncbi:hypothetical protein RSAG8_11519, partial [Rhizoctonia solani AG-8 WAC10335]
MRPLVYELGACFTFPLYISVSVCIRSSACVHHSLSVVLCLSVSAPVSDLVLITGYEPRRIPRLRTCSDRTDESNVRSFFPQNLCVFPHPQQSSVDRQPSTHCWMIPSQRPTLEPVH